jgi:hypothetical protein
VTMVTLQTRELEPFNIPPVDNTQAALFMRRLTGREAFTFPGAQKPIGMIVYDLKFAHPRHSYAHGFLLSVSADAFQRACETSNELTMEPLFKRYVIGKIHIEYGGTLQSTVVTAEALDLR